MEKLKAFCCWSGGKDSSMALNKALKDGFEIKCLLNMMTESGKHSRTHGVSSKLLKMQADAMGIEICQRKAAWESYEDEFKKVVPELKKEGIEYGIFGDIDLLPHREWVERVCKEAGIKPVLPLWKKEREDLLNEFINLGFKSVVCAIDSSQMSEEWLGRDIDKKFIEELKQAGGVDLCGEKGEYHSFVYEGPIFKSPIKIKKHRKIQKGKHCFLEISAE